ncbi:methylated-DNA--[protein]-cysteine S-methyltransferase [Ornithinimicrobium sp. Y1694]|uniref:methylated-DNA--[protein]-cysteine S-methyltransferase n=1 Tax=Ornithinimicrobium sp. Y1694 TaxID=3418590 RepID=UPI003CF8584C
MTTRPNAAHTRTAHLTVDSPVGPLRLTTDGDHLTGVYFAEHRHAPEDLGAEVSAQQAPQVLRDAAAQLAEYFAGEREDFDLPLASAGTDFQERVWAHLRAIPYGQTWSYGQLASALGQPNASRAVGLANGKNPISIVVPCHRVVGSDGSITGYGGGVERKQRLLDLERGAALF